MTAFRNVPLRRLTPPIASPCVPWTLAENEATIVSELNAVQGKPMDVGGYYAPNPELAARAMRPSTTFNRALASF